MCTECARPGVTRFLPNANVSRAKSPTILAHPFGTARRSIRIHPEGIRFLLAKNPQPPVRRTAVKENTFPHLSRSPSAAAVAEDAAANDWLVLTSALEPIPCSTLFTHRLFRLGAFAPLAGCAFAMQHRPSAQTEQKHTNIMHSLPLPTRPNSAGGCWATVGGAATRAIQSFSAS